MAWHRIRLARELALVAAAAWTATAGVATAAPAAKEPVEALPVLVTKGGDAPRWKNLEQLRQFAAKGDPAACFELGDRLMDGTDLKQDYVQARALFQVAAQGGVADAWFRLGKMFHDGLGGSLDYGQAFEYYTEAARLGVPEAQFNLGAMLVSGRGVKRDYTEGLAWLIVAGKSGVDPSAEKQVRERLAKRPADVAAAEARAKELLARLETDAKNLAPKAVLNEKPPEPPRALEPPALPPTTPPKIEIKLSPAPPAIDPPAKP
jgi:hypothetical protein